MKKFLFSSLIAILAFNAQAQISIGPKVGFGLGQIKSKNLKENLDLQRQMDADIIEWKVKNRPGLFLSLGGFFQYDISDKFALLGELTFNNLSSSIRIQYEENDLDGTRSGEVEKIDSKAKINSSFVSLPILAKYSISENGPFILGGFRVNFTGSPKIKSEETRDIEVYSNGMLIGKRIESRSVSADLHAFGSPRIDFVLGAGTAFEVSGKKLFLEMRYNHPLSRTEMYTTNMSFDDIAFKNNEHFSVWGKRDAEFEVPGVNLNDFRMGFIELSASYALFSK